MHGSRQNRGREVSRSNGRAQMPLPLGVRQGSLSSLPVNGPPLRLSVPVLGEELIKDQRADGVLRGRERASFCPTPELRAREVRHDSIGGKTSSGGKPIPRDAGWIIEEAHVLVVVVDGFLARTR